MIKTEGRNIGAEGGTRTPMGSPPLRPERSVSTNFTTSAIDNENDLLYFLTKTVRITKPDRTVNRVDAVEKTAHEIL